MYKSTYRSPWESGWREKAWKRLGGEFDVIIIGGGITGAGILAVAAHSGMRALLLEKGDFSSGTSSRSSKLVHGGLRYLKRMDIKLTRESVKERQYLLRSAQGLVEPLGFIYPLYEGESPGPWLIGIGLGIYTRLASDAGTYKKYDPLSVSMMAPGLTLKDMECAYQYTDAQTDDARLVLRVLHDSILSSNHNAFALNYAEAVSLIHHGDRVRGVEVRDGLTEKTKEVTAPVVINATGVWADRLRSAVGSRKRLRPLRGSHLFFRLDRFPVFQSIAFTHPDDGRPVFVYPWEGAALVGTTDVDFRLSLDDEPAISQEEAEYLLRAVQNKFPDLELQKEDVLSTQAGVRPVVSGGKKDPSAESRDHVVWNEKGLLTVTGGKLTTFRLIAMDALKEAQSMSKRISLPKDGVQIFDVIHRKDSFRGIDAITCRRLTGRYGAAAEHVVKERALLLSPIQGTPYFWEELYWAIKNEAVCHLDDLMLRRFRLGILLKDGGTSLLPKIRFVMMKDLNWDEKRWKTEVVRYKKILQTAHGLPDEWKKKES